MIARCGICDSELAVSVPTLLLHNVDGSHEAVVQDHPNGSNDE